MLAGELSLGSAVVAEEWVDAHDASGGTGPRSRSRQRREGTRGVIGGCGPGDDYSQVAPLSAYPAKQCPVRLQYDLMPPPGTVPVEPDATVLERREEGITFERAMLARARRPAPRRGPPPRRLGRRRADRAAIRDGAPLILGGALPDDLEGRRSGRPDLLVRVEGGYLPGDVKLHGLTEAKAGPGAVVLPDRPVAGGGDRGGGAAARARPGARDACQLAHYWRMLEHHGYAAPGPARGVILDRRQLLWWLDLDQPRRRVWWQQVPATWLEVYDREFAFRRDVARHTQARLAGDDLPPKVTPCWISECNRCPWREVCRAELEEVDHVSLLSGSTWERFVEHRRRGVLTRHDVAGLDVPTAVAVDGLTETMWGTVERADPAAAPRGGPRPEARGGGRTRGARAAHLRRSHRTPRRAHGVLPWRAGVGRLLPLIDEARATVSGTPHRRRGVAALDLPEAVVELDVDMESDAEGRNYLWGVLPTIAGARGEYVPVDSYEELTDEVEGEVFAEFLTLLAELRGEAERRGGVLRIHHWTAAELTAMRRIVAKQAVPGLPDRPALEAMIAEEWVDLAAVWRRAVLSGASAGLKVVAGSLGFAWDVEDPGGDYSMLQHAAAVGGDDTAVSWLRSYNRSDVLATYEIRRWLRASFDALPRIEDWRGLE